MVRRAAVWRESASEAALEVPPVSTDGRAYAKLCIYGPCFSLSGYLLFPLFLLAAHLGGAWSNWSVNNSVFVVRLLAFTVSPIVLLAAVLVRVRCVRFILVFSSTVTQHLHTRGVQDLEDEILLNMRISISFEMYYWCCDTLGSRNMMNNVLNARRAYPKSRTPDSCVTCTGGLPVANVSCLSRSGPGFRRDWSDITCMSNRCQGSWNLGLHAVG